jgi:tRNA-splicing ligase RtcB
MCGVIIHGEHDARTIAQMDRCMGVGSAVAGVLCADGHLGYAQPVGGVVAYEEHVSVSGVGFDVGCGNMAVKLDATRAGLGAGPATLVADIARAVSFGVGRKNAERVDNPLFESPVWRDVPEIGHLEARARDQPRHGRLRQPLRRPLRGRGGLRVDRRALRLARPRPRRGDHLRPARRRPRRHRR